MQIRIDGLKELIGKMPILKRAADLAMIRDWQMLNRRARQDAPAKTDGVIAMAIALHARGGNNAS